MKHSTLKSIRDSFALIRQSMGKGGFFLLMMLLFVTNVTAIANPVNAERARLVAKTFLNNNGARSTGLTDITSEVGISNVYVFTTANSFVILAADDCERPILGYSLNGGFDLENMPENKAAWIQEYSDGIRYAIDHQMRASSEVLQLWNDLAAGRPDAGRAVTVVSPLVQTQWNQGSPYNLLCPSSSVTGCVATAMAQVMKYWNYPEHGIGAHSYTHSNYGVLSADFQSTNYDWTNMLNSYTSSSNYTQKMAVATLMYHCGVSVDMNYSPSSSGAVTALVADALKNYFNYSSQTQHYSRSDYDDNTWIAMLKADLDLNRPIQYHGSGSGGGHSFVFDGYNSSNYFHVNWGWGGYCDEYYQVSNLNPGPGGIGSGSNGIYNDNQGAILHAHPSDCVAGTPTNLTYTQNDRNITLNWNTASNAASYNVYCNNNYVANVTTNTYTGTAPYGSSEYYVRSVDAAGELSLSSNAVAVSVTYPVPVVDDLAANITGNNIGLTWTAPDWCYPETPSATLNYGEGSVYYSWTYTYYAHRYLASSLASYAGKAIYKVSTYVQYPGDYTVYVYTNSNGNQPMASALAVTKTIHCSNSNLWLDFDFDAPIILSGTTDLWVVMNVQNTGATYPTPSFNLSSHNTNAFYAGSSPTSLYDAGSSYNCAWLISTFLTDGEYTYNLYRNGSCIANHVSSTSYADNNLAPGTYNYIVKTNYYGGESGASNQVTAVIGSGDYYSIQASANPTNGGTVTGTGSYTEGSTCTLTATPNAGYSFVNWTKNGQQVSTNSTYTFTVTGDASYVANFEVATYQITATAIPSSGGSVTGGGTFNFGQTCTLTATPNSGYTFCSWTEYGTVVSEDPSYTFTVEGDRNLEANFYQAPTDVCNIIITMNDSYGDGWNGNYLVVNYSEGCVPSEQITLDNGSTGTASLEVGHGSHIVLGWIEGQYTYECTFTIAYESGAVICEGSNLNSGYFFEFDVDCNASVPYYDITATANPAIGGTVDGYGSYAEGSYCTLTATPNAGYSFVNWTKNGQQVSANASYTFTVTEAGSYVANFENNNPGNIIEIGDGTSTTYMTPFNSLYGYSFTEQIFFASEIGSAITINSIGFNLSQSYSTAQTNDIVLYMKNVTRDSFTSSTDYEPVTLSDVVFSGSWTIPANYTGWVTIDLDTPFAYDGTSNLMIAMDENTSGYSTRYFTCTSVTNSGLSYYSDSNNPNPYDLGSYSGSMVIRSNRSNIQLEYTTGGGGSGELTIHDGTTTNSYVPVYGFYADAYLKSEAVYPAAELAEMMNSNINSIKYYSSNSNVSWGSANFQVFLTEVNDNTISSFYGPGTIVYTGALSIVDGVMVVNFTTPYHYNGGNLLVGVYNTVTGSYVSCSWYGETVTGASVQGYDFSSPSSVTATQRNFLPKTTFSYTGSGAPTVNLAVTPDPIDLGPRPNGAWMRPYTFTLENLASAVDITDIEVTGDYFTLQNGDLTIPFTLGAMQSVTMGMDWGEGIGDINANLVVTHAEGQSTFDVTALAYDPAIGDVWEYPIEIYTFPYYGEIDAANTPYYNNYVMPLPEIEDGNDVVYKLTFDNDTYLNAAVTSGDNGKVALYPEGFKGLGGPDENNYYTNPLSAVTGAPYEVQIGEGTSTSGYCPFYTLYNYSIGVNLYTAEELEAAGATSAPMTSLSWYATNTTGYAQQGISIWMANVPDTEVSIDSPLASDMTLVYTGTVTPEIGWNEFVFNEGSFAWDGSSNVLILCQRNNGSWNSSIQWQTHDPGFYAQGYLYTDNNPYDVATTTYGMYISSSARPNIIMKGGMGGRGDRGNRDLVEIGDGTGTTYYFPVDNYFNYSCTEQIYTAEEIGTAGTINAISFYYNYGTAYTANNVTMYMKNVSRSNFASTTDCEPLSVSDIVWTGSIAPTTSGWYTFTLDTPFEYNGTDNLLVAFFDGTSGYPGTSYTWRQTTSPNSAYMSLRYYSDSYSPDPYNLSSFGGSKQWYTYRTNIQLDITPNGGYVVGPEITDMTVVPGTYYLVASSTSDEFTVEINTSAVPCPEDPTLVYPDNYGRDLDPNHVLLKWGLDNRATEYALRVGTSINNLETVVDWTRDLAQAHTLHNLDYNTIYYWQVLQRNDDCTESVEGPIWRFTTWLNTPYNLYAINGNEIMEGDVIQLAWSAPDAGSELVGYEVYMNGDYLGSTTATFFEVAGLSYNTNWYEFNVMAVYFIDNINQYSYFSNSEWVAVNGYGTVEGYVYEQDGTTGIPHATVTAFGYDYFGYYWTQEFTTDENGYYTGQMPTGYGYSAFANVTGYQEGYYDGGFDVEYITTTSGINIILDEQFVGPTGVTAQYYPDPNDLESSSVQVTWDDNLWHTYCEYEWQAAWVTYSGNTTWGYNYPTEVLVPYVGYTLNKVALYSDTWPAVGGNYTCNVYTGGETPAEGTLVSSITVDVPQNLGRWVSYPLATPVSITSGTSIWVIWTANTSLGGYPAGCCYNDYSNENGDWWYNFDENLWQHLAEVEGYPGLCWTMRNHFSDGAGRSVVLGAPNPPTPRRFSSSKAADLAPKTLANNGKTTSCINANAPRIPLKRPEQDRSLQYYRVYRTDYFNDGPFTTENTVLIADNVTDYSVIDDTFGDLETGTYKYGVSAVYEGNRETRISWMQQKYEVEECQKMLSKMGHSRDTYNFDFEDDLQGWTNINADGDTLNWVHSSGSTSQSGYDYTGLGHDGSDGFVYSQSYIDYSGAIDANNYLVSPMMYTIQDDSYIEFWADNSNDSYPDYFEICLSTADHPTADDFFAIYGGQAKGNNGGEKAGIRGNDNQQTRYNNWRWHHVDLNAYSGMNVWIAFHHQDYDAYEIWIDDVSINTGSQPLQLDRESEIIWSNPMDKDMYLYDAVDITVTLNSGDSPENVYVELYQDNSQSQINPLNNTLNFYMDETGYHAWDLFRKGTYYVYLWKDGYQYIYDMVTIEGETHLVYELEEIMESVTDLYVSRTGWASWKGLGNDAPDLTNHHYDSELFTDFEQGLPEGWMCIDADGDGYNWMLGSLSPGVYHNPGVNTDGLGHEASNGFMCSASWTNAAGMALNPDNYLVSPQVALGGTFSFWACAQDSYYAADHFGVAVSTTSSTDPNAFTVLTEWTMTAKGVGSKAFAGSTRSGNRDQGAWYQYTVDLSEYAGRTGYIAIRHFNCYDQFILNVDDVELTSVRNNGNRHFEAIEVTLTDMDDNVLYTGTTENDYMQLPTENLTEGQVYKLSVVQTYSSGLTSVEASCRWVYQPCDNFEGANDLNAIVNANGVTISWTYPEVNNDSVETRENNENYLQYCTEVYDGGVGTGGGAVYWGIRFPADDLTAYVGQTLTKVGIFTDVDGDYGWTYSGNYTARVYLGGATAPGTLVSEATEYLAGDSEWHDITLTTPVTIDGTQDLWLTFYTADIAYPMSGCVYTDEPNSDFLSLDGVTWEHSSDYGLNYTWMIRGLVEGASEPSPVGDPFATAIFRNGEWIAFVVDAMYIDEDGTENDEYEVRVVYGGTRQCPYNNAYFTMSCPQTVEIGGEITQTTDFAQNWNWWSTYIDQQGIDGLTTLEDGLGANGVQIKSQTNFVTNYGVFWMGMLQNINNDESYMIQTNAACQVELSGMPVSPANHPITINQGWNWIGYPCTNTMSVTQAFANYTPMNGDQVKSQSDYAMYFSGIWIGQLQNITPGMGLMYKSNNATPMTLVYPNAGRDEEAVVPKDMHWTNDIHAYPNNMTVMAVVELDGVELQSDNYELAAFANGECRGSAKLMYVEPLNRYMAFLTISGDEAAELNFGLYNSETYDECFESDNMLVFMTNATVGSAEEPFVVSFRDGMGINELNKLVTVYPSPVAAGNLFSIGLSQISGKVSVDIINALGSVISSETYTDTPVSLVAPKVSGVYLLRVSVEGKGSCLRKLIVK